MFEVFDHTADLGIRVRGSSLDELFAEFGRGLFSVVVSDLASVKLTVERSYELAGTELDYLLFDWLTELLFTFDSEKLLLASFDVRVDDAGLRATCRGEPIDATRHALEHEIKAITYHGLKVKQSAEGWLAEVIVDI